MTTVQLMQVIYLVAQLTGQPADLMVELARAESGLQADALADMPAQGVRFDEAVEAGASGGLYCLQWETAQWAAQRVGLEISPDDLADPWLNAFLAAKLLEWGYGGWFHALERVPADVRPMADDRMFRNAPMWRARQ